MSADKLVDSTQLDSDLTSVANAIRAKSGGSSQLAFPAGFVSEIGNIPSGGGGNFTLIAEKEITLSAYTNTSTVEKTDTQINISNTDYAFGYIVITCDSQVQSATDWGMSLLVFGRYTTGTIATGQACLQRGTATLSKAALSNREVFSNSYGVWADNNSNTVVLCRRANSDYANLRAGKYTVKVYGMTAI